MLSYSRMLSYRCTTERDHVKIFGIGLSRTGTTSLALALEMLGYSVIHFPHSMHDIERHDAALDTPVAANFIELDRRFPGSRFIYTSRSLEPWLASCCRFWQKYQEILFDQTPFIVDLHQRLYGGSSYDKQRFSTAYQRHTALVDNYFQSRPESLLTLNLTEEVEPWVPLCSFLGVPVPHTDFPASNQSSATDELILRLLTVIGTPEKVAVVAGVPLQYVLRVRVDAPVAGASATRLLSLTTSWEMKAILRRTTDYFGSISRTCQLLTISEPHVRAILQRRGEL